MYAAAGCGSRSGCAPAPALAPVALLALLLVSGA